MSGRRRRRLWLAAACVTGLLPPLLLLGVSYFQAVQQTRERLDRYAALTQERADQIFGAAQTTLAQLAQQIAPRCSEATVSALRRTVYNSLYFREAGLIVAGALRCTSERTYDPPVPMAAAGRRATSVPGIYISPPAPTPEREISIVVSYGIGEDAAVDVLLNPALIGEPLQKLFVADQVSVSLQRSDGTELAHIGPPLPAEESLQTVRASARFPIRAIAASSRAALLRNWRVYALLYGSGGLLLSALLLLLLSRLGRAQLAPEARLADALEDGEFQVYYQPVIETATGVCVGAEALLRWRHPQLGLLTPDVFIKTAEESGFIVPLTHWLIQRIVTDMAAVLGAHPQFHISLNLSAGHFLDPTLIDSIHANLGGRIAPARLIFEITEHQLIDEGQDRAHKVLNELHATGASIALDDFGTGYSNLKTLSRFPFDYLKIDKIFVDAIGTESITARLIENIVDIARRLKLRTIAEGVETREQLEYLRDLNVDYIQGWIYSKALPPEEFYVFLRNHLRPAGA
jgi:sensor c-di-GMP phosphodiesterase-like protein